MNSKRISMILLIFTLLSAHSARPAAESNNIADYVEFDEEMQRHARKDGKLEVIAKALGIPLNKNGFLQFNKQPYKSFVKHYKRFNPLPKNNRTNEKLLEERNENVQYAWNHLKESEGQWRTVLRTAHLNQQQPAEEQKNPPVLESIPASQITDLLLTTQQYRQLNLDAALDTYFTAKTIKEFDDAYEQSNTPIRITKNDLNCPREEKNVLWKRFMNDIDFTLSSMKSTRPFNAAQSATQPVVTPTLKRLALSPRDMTSLSKEAYIALKDELAHYFSPAMVTALETEFMVKNETQMPLNRFNLVYKESTSTIDTRWHDFKVLIDRTNARLLIAQSMRLDNEADDADLDLPDEIQPKTLPAQEDHGIELSKNAYHLIEKELQSYLEPKLLHCINDAFTNEGTTHFRLNQTMMSYYNRGNTDTRWNDLKIRILNANNVLASQSFRPYENQATLVLSPPSAHEKAPSQAASGKPNASANQLPENETVCFTPEMFNALKNKGMLHQLLPFKVAYDLSGKFIRNNKEPINIMKKGVLALCKAPEQQDEVWQMIVTAAETAKGLENVDANSYRDNLTVHDMKALHAARSQSWNAHLQKGQQRATEIKQPDSDSDEDSTPCAMISKGAYQVLIGYRLVQEKYNTPFYNAIMARADTEFSNQHKQRIFLAQDTIRAALPNIEHDEFDTLWADFAVCAQRANAIARNQETKEAVPLKKNNNNATTSNTPAAQSNDPVALFWKAITDDDALALETVLDGGGIDVTKPNRDNWTAYAFATKFKKRNVIPILLREQKRRKSQCIAPASCPQEAAPKAIGSAETPEQVKERMAFESLRAQLDTNSNALSDEQWNDLRNALLEIRSSTQSSHFKKQLSSSQKRKLYAHFPELAPAEVVPFVKAASAQPARIPDAQKPKHRAHASSAQKTKNDQNVRQSHRQHLPARGHQLPANAVATLRDPLNPRTSHETKADDRAVEATMKLTPAPDAATTHLVAQRMPEPEKPAPAEKQVAHPVRQDINGFDLLTRKLLDGQYKVKPNCSHAIGKKLAGMHHMNEAKAADCFEKGLGRKVHQGRNLCWTLLMTTEDGQETRKSMYPRLQSGQILKLIKLTTENLDFNRTQQVDGQTRFIFRGTAMNPDPALGAYRECDITSEFVLADDLKTIITVYPVNF